MTVGFGLLGRWVMGRDEIAAVTEGIVAGTRVASAIGWRPAEAICAGDRVLTFDNGLQPVVEVRRDWIPADRELAPRDWPVVVPAGVLGNRVDLVLMPDQKVMIEADAAEAIQGDPFAVVAASALVGWRGIARVRPLEPVQVVTLVFAQDQVVYGSSALMLYCPSAQIQPVGAQDLMAQAGRCDYVPLTGVEADLLVACLIAEDAGDARRAAGRPGRQAALA